MAISIELSDLVRQDLEMALIAEGLVPFVEHSVIVEELTAVDNENGTAAVAWEIPCDVGEFGGYGIGDRLQILIHGLTAFRRFDQSLTFDVNRQQVIVHRFIDWLEVAEQLGMTLTRPVIPADQDPTAPRR